MIDVHPPHQATHTWTDFFIHIATIAVGLLIAIGLEQTVEYFHHRHQANEMEAALHHESLTNRHVIDYDLKSVDDERRVIRLNMDALDRIRLSGDKQPFTPVPLPHEGLFAPIDTAWTTLRNNGLLSMVPNQLANNYWKVDFMSQASTGLIGTAFESTRKVNVLLSLHSNPAAATAEERTALLRAYGELDQSLHDLHNQLTALNIGNELALAGKPMDIKDFNEANKPTPGK
jgi:hypothetical protein